MPLGYKVFEPSGKTMVLVADTKEQIKDRVASM